MKSRITVLSLVAALGLVLPAAADQRDDLMQGMSKCSAIGDNTARLACYDALKPQLNAALQVPPPPTTPTAEQRFGNDHQYAGGVSDKPQTKPEQFGSERLPPAEQAKVYPVAPGQPEEIDTISATLTEYAYNAAGHFIVFLDNGQIWQALDNEKALFRREPKNNTVTISRGLFGSYSLQLNGANRIFKVKRMK